MDVQREAKTSWTRNVDNLTFDVKRERKSFIYAKCRYAIHADMFVRARHNVAGARNWANASKKTIINLLEGKVNWQDKLVEFPDGTKAKL